MGFGKAFDKVQEVIMFSLIFSFLSYSVSLYINQCVYVLSFDELLELSHQGNNRVVDMLVGDIYGGTDYAKVQRCLYPNLDYENFPFSILMYV